MGLFDRVLSPRTLLKTRVIDRFGHEPVFQVSLRGSYSSGSAGKQDVQAVEVLVRSEVQQYKTENRIEGNIKAILDLRGYYYSWGDDFVYILDFFDLTRRYAIVVSAKCRRGISTLIKMDPGTKYDCLEGEGFFLTIEEALDYLETVK